MCLNHQARGDSHGCLRRGKCTAAQITMRRSAVGALLFLCCTSVDTLADVVMLQKHVRSAKIVHFKIATRIIFRAQQYAILD